MLRSHLAVLHSTLWTLFLVWTGLECMIIPFDLGPAQVADWVHDTALQEALTSFLNAADAVWIVLAAINVYFSLAEAEGIRTARRWAGTVLAASATVETIGALTGLPFGPFVYTDRLGLRIGGSAPVYNPPALDDHRHRRAIHGRQGIAKGESAYYRARGRGNRTTD